MSERPLSASAACVGLGDSTSAVVEDFDRVGSDPRVGLEDLMIREFALI